MKRLSRSLECVSSGTASELKFKDAVFKTSAAKVVGAIGAVNKDKSKPNIMRFELLLKVYNISEVARKTLTRHRSDRAKCLGFLHKFNLE
jgi:hypothetical protein